MILLKCWGQFHLFQALRDRCFRGTCTEFTHIFHKVMALLFSFLNFNFQREQVMLRKKYARVSKDIQKHCMKLASVQVMYLPPSSLAQIQPSSSFQSYPRPPTDVSLPITLCRYTIISLPKSPYYLSR